MSAKAPGAPSPAPVIPALAQRASWVCALVLLLVAAVSYHNSFSGPFIFDDLNAIEKNPSITRLVSAFSPPLGSTVTGRPVANLTLALNHAIGGLHPAGYHAFNLLIHALAGLLLFGVVRRVLTLPALRERFARDATLLACAIAALWLAHPLQTEAVTYVVQRVESLMAFFYLLTLYCFLRSGVAPSPSAGRWQLAAVVACVLGMGTKEVMVSAPLMVLLFDRTLVSGGFAEAWRRRRGFYAALASTWLLLAWLVTGVESHGGSAGFATVVSSADYALTQCRAIIHYLGLAAWPGPLVFDYGAALVRTPGEIALQAAIIVALVAGTIRVLWKQSIWGLAGAWFFAILAPSSSIVPVATQTIAEHRMYLPLAAVIASVVLGGHALFGRRFLVFWLAAVVACSALTLRRNEIYGSARELWQDTVAKRPDNPRAHFALGCLLVENGEGAAAAAAFERTLALKPDFSPARHNLGLVLHALGRSTEAAPHLQAAVTATPDDVEARLALCGVLTDLGRLEEALPHYEVIARARPDSAEAHHQLGNALLALRRIPELLAQTRETLRLQPDHVDARVNQGVGLFLAGRVPEAAECLEAVARARPDSARARYFLGVVLAGQGRLKEAAAHFEKALQIDPRLESARESLALIRAEIARRETGQ